MASIPSRNVPNRGDRWYWTELSWVECGSGLRLCFHTSHTRPYSHLSVARGISGGEAGDVPWESGADMSSNLNGDISEVKFLTVAEVAAVMRVSKMTVYRLVHSGELPAVRVGRSFRVSEQDVNDYLKNSFYQTG